MVSNATSQVLRIITHCISPSYSVFGTLAFGFQLLVSTQTNIYIFDESILNDIIVVEEIIHINTIVLNGGVLIILSYTHCFIFPYMLQSYIAMYLQIWEFRVLGFTITYVFSLGFQSTSSSFIYLSQSSKRSLSW